MIRNVTGFFIKILKTLLNLQKSMLNSCAFSLCGNIIFLMPTLLSYLLSIHKWSFGVSLTRVPAPISALCSRNYPQNINYMPAGTFFVYLNFEKNCHSLIVSWRRVMCGLLYQTLVIPACLLQAGEGGNQYFWLFRRFWIAASAGMTAIFTTLFMMI